MNGLIKSLVVSLASVSGLNTVYVNGGIEIRSNFNRKPGNETVVFSSSQVEDVYKNKIQIYDKSGKGRRYPFQVGARTENYFRRGNFSWSGERVDRMAVSDFNSDGINDVLFFSQASKNGMMATYDERSRAFLLVPVTFDR